MAFERSYSNSMPLGISKAVRIIYPRIDKLYTYKEGDKPSVSASFIVPKDHPELAAHKAAVSEILKKAYGPIKSENGKLFTTTGKRVEVVTPFRDGDEEVAAGLSEGKDLSYLAGCYKIKADTKPNPKTGLLDFSVFDARVRDARGSPKLVQGEEAIRSLIYGGCHVAVSLVYGAKEANGGYPGGVKAFLKSVCFVGDGERIGFDPVGSQANLYASVQGAVSQESVAGGELDDEILF